MSEPSQLGQEPDETLAHLRRGLKVPEIALPSTTGAPVSLARHAGWSVVYCYPWTGRPGRPDPPNWDDIPGAHGSTPQTLSYASLYSGFLQVGVSVFGLSTQSSDYQQEMTQRLHVPFAILSDEQFAFSDALSLPRFETGGVTYLKRLTIAIRDGLVQRVFYRVAVPETDAREVLAWISAHLNYSVEARVQGSN